MPDEDKSVTEALRDWKQRSAGGAGRVVESLYGELHRISTLLLSSERPDHTLQPTALIHELYLRLAGAEIPEWRNRAHFLAVAANTLRRILIDHARTHRTQRRGGKQVEVPVDQIEVGVACSYDNLLIIDEALNQLERADTRAARVAELRFFAGLELSEIAEELGVAEITVSRDWKFARAWLASRLGPGRTE
jgi:RNA polymerase sigma factor (TIGR02999 family)